MPAILLHLLAAALYLSLAVHFWRTRWRGPALDQPPSRLGTLARIWLLVAIVAHGITVVTELFGGGQMRFGFAVAVSLMLWLALAFYWMESFYARMEGLQMLGLPLAA